MFDLRAIMIFYSYGNRNRFQEPMGALPERGRPVEDLNSPFLSDERGSIFTF